MTKATVVIEQCKSQSANAEVIAIVDEMLSQFPGVKDRLKQAKRIIIKLNLGVPGCTTYKNHPIAYTDPAVYEGGASFLRDKTNAIIMAGDGCDGNTPTVAVQERGHMDIVNTYGHQFVDLHQHPFVRFHIPEPAMFRWYDLTSALQDVDMFISIAKMKSHHLCGVTLTMKKPFWSTAWSDLWVTQIRHITFGN